MQVTKENKFYEDFVTRFVFILEEIVTAEAEAKAAKEAEEAAKLLKKQKKPVKEKGSKEKALAEKKLKIIGSNKLFYSEQKMLID